MAWLNNTFAKNDLNSMQLFSELRALTKQAVQSIYSIDVDESIISIGNTKPDFDGDYTIVVFSLLKFVKGNPVEIGTKIGEYLVEHSQHVTDFNVIKGFLNLTIANDYFVQFASTIDENFFHLPKKDKKIVLEYIGPNTNKPLHLGHIRNILVGYSMAEILSAAGYDVPKVTIFNDRGIAICKSMVAWENYGNDETPESTSTKGDHFVGKYYVKYAQVESEQAQPYISQGMDKREAAKQTAIHKQAQEYVQKWEQEDEHVLSLWNQLNEWFFAGFHETLKELEVDFEKAYYESKTYKHGKQIVEEGLEQGVFYKQEDGSVAVDLEDVKLDQKVLLRGDGTSLYITQDIGTADLRYADYQMDESMYVVGNEQDYHFNVLKETLIKLGKPYAAGINHLSYGMVDLPDGKMKSREGTVVDADMIIDEMRNTAQGITEELSDISDFTNEEKQQLYHNIGMGALKFFILRVDPKKRILFNPEESIDFQGFTGPYVQYNYARTQSILRKAGKYDSFSLPIDLQPEEKNILLHLHDYPTMIEHAASQRNTSDVAKYVYDLAKLFSKFYANVNVLNEQDENTKNFRLYLCKTIGGMIEQNLKLLGIKAPEKM